MVIQRLNGTVAWFDDQQGVGMIKPDVEGVQVFVHFTQIYTYGLKMLAEGQGVSFEVADTKKGPAAFAVEITRN